MPILRFLSIDNIANKAPQVLLYRFARVVFDETIKQSVSVNCKYRSSHRLLRLYIPDFVVPFLSALYVDDFNEGASTTSLASESTIDVRREFTLWIGN